METAYKLAAAAVRQRFAEQHPEYLNILKSINKSDVSVYSGSFDHVEKILSCLNISHTINPDSHKFEAQMLFVNCSGSYPYNLPNDLKDRVEAGAWLASSDWALSHFIAKAFPNTIGWNSKSTPDEVISVEANLNSLWSEVVVLGADPQWWLEASSHPIKILDTTKIRVEAASHDLLIKYDAPVVAASFDWGKGHVFHVISHFWCKRSRTLTPRHQGACTDFLKAGMKLSDGGMEKIFHQTKINPEQVNFAQLQSAATSTELVAQLCVKAIGGT